MKIIKGKQFQPRAITVYGVPAVGKSTAASKAEKPLFLDFENGVNDLDVHKTPVIKQYHEFLNIMQECDSPDIPYKTLVVDSLDWLQSILWADIATKHGKESVAEIPYGAGFKIALEQWKDIIQKFDRLRRTRGLALVFLAHADVKRYEDPVHGSYDRHVPALHPAAAALWVQYCDEVFFATYRLHVRKEQRGFQQEKQIAVGTSERIFYTTETPAVMAKNRLGLPEQIPLDWSVYQDAIRKNHNNPELESDDG